MNKVTVGGNTDSIKMSELERGEMGIFGDTVVMMSGDKFIDLSDGDRYDLSAAAFHTVRKLKSGEVVGIRVL